jgi:hypothetical protein
MTSRAACVAALTLFALQGCTRTIHYAVVVPLEAMEEPDSCFRQCQMLRPSGTKHYLECLRTCQEDIRIVKESKCKDVQFDAEEFDCNDEHNQKFNPGPGFIVILVAVMLWFVVGSASS